MIWCNKCKRKGIVPNVKNEHNNFTTRCNNQTTLKMKMFFNLCMKYVHFLNESFINKWSTRNRMKFSNCCISTGLINPGFQLTFSWCMAYEYIQDEKWICFIAHIYVHIRKHLMTLQLLKIKLILCPNRIFFS